MRKLILFLIILTLTLTVGCSSSTPKETSTASTETTSTTGELELTVEELAKYDGSDGNPAYIAIEGIIYDVSSVKAWFNGKHNGYTAGKDLTTEMKDLSPHGLSKLKGLDVVGKLVD